MWGNCKNSIANLRKYKVNHCKLAKSCRNWGQWLENWREQSFLSVFPSNGLLFPQHWILWFFSPSSSSDISLNMDPGQSSALSNTYSAGFTSSSHLASWWVDCSESGYQSCFRGLVAPEQFSISDPANPDWSEKSHVWDRSGRPGNICCILF